MLKYHGGKANGRDVRAQLRRSHLDPHFKRAAGGRPEVDDQFPIILTSYEVFIKDLNHLAR